VGVLRDTGGASFAPSQMEKIRDKTRKRVCFMRKEREGKRMVVVE